MNDHAASSVKGEGHPSHRQPWEAPLLHEIPVDQATDGVKGANAFETTPRGEPPLGPS